MITLKDWHKHEPNRIGWKLVMDQPLAKEALEVARNHMMPKTLHVTSDNADTIRTVAALEQARLGGWFAALSFLEDVLSSSPPTEKQSLKPRTLNPDS